MNAPSRRMALTTVTAALIMVFNTLPLGLPVSLNPLPLRVPSTVVTLIVSIIDPWAGAFGAIIGHFAYDFIYLGLGATPALVGGLCYVPFGYIMKRPGNIIRKIVAGSLLCIAWITFTLTIGFWLLKVMPIEVAFTLILSSISLTFILSDLILIPILPRLRRYIAK
jgi:hypothetical protein